MIKLKLIDKPVELTDEVCQQLTDKYKADKSSVWNKAYIRNALLRMTNNKCAYSEAPLNINGTYMEVEHFRCKEKYPDKVVEWGNLLPVCKTCNVTKGEWDVEVDGAIINPLEDNPSDFLFVKSLRFYPKNNNEKGQNTIDRLDLNNKNQFEIPRAKVYFEIVNNLEIVVDKLSGDDTKKKEKNSINKIKQCLKEAFPQQIYSAVLATSILESEEYKNMKDIVASKGLWDADFDEIERTLNSIALFKNR